MNLTLPSLCALLLLTGCGLGQDPASPASQREAVTIGPSIPVQWWLRCPSASVESDFSVAQPSLQEVLGRGCVAQRPINTQSTAVLVEWKMESRLDREACEATQVEFTHFDDSGAELSSVALRGAFQDGVCRAGNGICHRSRLVPGSFLLRASDQDAVLSIATFDPKTQADLMSLLLTAIYCDQRENIDDVR